MTLLEVEWLVIAAMALDGALLALVGWAYYAPHFAGHRLSDQLSMRIEKPRRVRIMLGISTLSLMLVFGFIRLLHDALFVSGEVTVLTVLWQTAAVLLVYDFTYYFLHRFMHLKRVMRWVHGVHHRARNPSAFESFFLHPAELVAGLALLFASTWLVGPVHVYSFGLVFLVHSTLNILVHSGLDSRMKVLFPIDFLAKKHHVHHHVDFGKNYSSLTPLPDLVFGTAG